MPRPFIRRTASLGQSETAFFDIRHGTRTDLDRPREQICRARSSLHELSDGAAFPAQRRGCAVRLLACRAARGGKAITLCAYPLLPPPLPILRVQHEGHPALCARCRLPARARE